MRQRLFVSIAVLGVALGVAGCDIDTTNVPLAYLKQAKVAVEHRDAAAATAALDHAEGQWLDRNTPYGDPFFTLEPEALREMGRARQAIAMGRWGDAEYYVAAAMTHPTMLTPGAL